jgi:O-antigen/teichoic acid export membrane protein
MTLIGPILLKVRQFTAVVRLRPFDTSTAAGRASERHRRIALSAIGAMAARVVNIVSVFAVVGLTVGYLGSDRYGLWMTLTALMTFASFADLGVSQGLMTLLAQGQGRDDSRLSLAYVSGAFMVLTVIAAVLLVVFLAVFPWVNWGHALGAVTPEAAREAGPALLVLVLGTLLMLPFSLAQNIRLGHQQTYVSNIWQTVASVATLGATLAAVRMRCGLVILAGIPVAVQILQFLADTVVLGVQRPGLRPRLSAVTRESLQTLFRIGALFFILALTRAVGFGSDNLVLAKVLGTESVTPYSVPQRLFGIAPLLLTFVLAPLWPAYAEAASRGDLQWVRRTLRRSLLLTIAIVVPLNIVLVVFAKPIIRLWVGGTVDPSYFLLIGLGLLSTLLTVSGVPAMFLNGMGVVRFQIIMQSVMAIVNVCLSIVLTRLMGTPGVVYGSIVAWTVCVLIPTWIYIPRLLRSAGEGKDSSPAAVPGELRAAGAADPA